VSPDRRLFRYSVRY